MIIPMPRYGSRAASVRVYSCGHSDLAARIYDGDQMSTMFGHVCRQCGWQTRQIIAVVNMHCDHLEMVALRVLDGMFCRECHTKLW